MLNRRRFFSFAAGVLAAPVVARAIERLPDISAATQVKRIGAWATATVRGGVITSITVTNVGSGYSAPPVFKPFGEPGHPIT